MNAPWTQETADLMLSCYLDGALDARETLDVEDWLRASPEGRSRLAQLREAQAALRASAPIPAVPSGWTLRAYQAGLPKGLPAPTRALFLGWGLSQQRPRARAHGLGRCRVLGRRRVLLRWGGSNAGHGRA